MVSVDVLRAAVEADPGRAGDDVADHAAPAATVGAGETVAAAAGRPTTGEYVLVVEDGRVVAVHPAAALRG